MVTAIELGLLYAIMALGVYLTFRILDFPDLTVDGSFATGAATTAITVVNGVDPILATVAGFAAGMAAGAVTGILHTKANIDGLLAGILTQIGLYSINIRIMGAPNISLLREDTLMSPLRESRWLGAGSWIGSLILLPAVLIILGLIVWFLHTDLGLAMRATGDNAQMIRSFGVSTDTQKILGLSISNGMVALSGSLVAQYQGYADVSMGIGIIVAGLASVIIGQAIIGRLNVFRAASAVVLGAILYRVVLSLAIDAGLTPTDTKLISAVLVIIALVVPQMSFLRRVPKAFRPKSEDALQNPSILPDDLAARVAAGETGAGGVVGAADPGDVVGASDRDAADGPEVGK